MKEKIEGTLLITLALGWSTIVVSAGLIMAVVSNFLAKGPEEGKDED